MPELGRRNPKTAMRILIDTNIFIPLEPASPADLEVTTPMASQLLATASTEGAQVLVHPSSIVDIRRDRNESRRELRLQMFQKYPTLEKPPDVDDVLTRVVGVSETGTNDWVDDQMLAAVLGDAVTYLVTEDGALRKKAERLGIGDRVVTIRDALELIQSLHAAEPRRLPHVEEGPLHAVPNADPIFESLRGDYPGFDEWLATAKRQGRRALTISGSDQHCAAICILKPGDDEHDFGRSVLKLSTFKVDSNHAGNRFGELLLKAVFEFSCSNTFDAIWVTVFPKHQDLLSMLEHFGFLDSAHRSSLGEIVMVKTLRPDAEHGVEDPFEYHRLHGPPSLCFAQAAEYVVPIQPQYHRILFPELADQVDDWMTDQARLGVEATVAAPFGNAIRKAYISNASIRSLLPGEILYFYRSGDLQGITTAGVVEETIVSESAEDVSLFVGSRTVYSLQQIRELATSPVLSILFRQDRHLDNPILVEELKANGSVTAPPQSIMRVREGGRSWLNEQVRRSR